MITCVGDGWDKMQLGHQHNIRKVGDHRSCICLELGARRFVEVYVYIYMFIYIYVCISVCVCVDCFTDGFEF